MIQIVHMCIFHLITSNRLLFCYIFFLLTPRWMKTSHSPSTYIVQQFFKHNFPVRHSATTKRNTYRSCLVCDTCIRELIVLDVPLQVRHWQHLKKLIYIDFDLISQIAVDLFGRCFYIDEHRPESNAKFLCFIRKISDDFL